MRTTNTLKDGTKKRIAYYAVEIGKIKVKQYVIAIQ